MKTHILFGILAVALSSSASAATRASGDYSLATETLDSGGLRAASTAFCNDGALGSIGGVSSVPTAAQIAKHSYVGQLYDITSLALNASSLTVNEGMTRLVVAYGLLDDSTLLQIPWRWVTWSIVDGPIAYISVTGLVTTVIVYQDTTGTVGGSAFGKYYTLTLQIRDRDGDNYGIYGGDGLPDQWQVNYFGTNNADGLFTVDPDLDGQNNGFEYLAGTDPTLSDSRFRLNIANVLDHADQKNLIFSPLAPGRLYQAVYRTNVDTGSFVDVYPSMINDVGAERTVTDLTATNEMRFYRVLINWGPP